MSSVACGLRAPKADVERIALPGRIIAPFGRIDNCGTSPFGRGRGIFRKSRAIRYYNTEHRRSGIAMLTPADVHAGLGPAPLAQRHAVMRAAFLKCPDRFVNGEPKLACVPETVWINKPHENNQAA